MATKINITDKAHQTMESFGASGAWWSQIVGGWENADEIAELLYGKDNGIGLNNYRYNIGAGSINNGVTSFHNKDRATESFDTLDGYDWSRDKNAVNMMKLAVKHGVDEVVMFVNSPPVSMTINGKSYCSKPGAKNLSPENYRKFATYCLDVCEHFIDEGIPVKYLSPVNEPVWIWSDPNNQEGCHYMPRDVRRLFLVFAEEIEKREKLKNVKLSGTECGDIRWFNKSFSRAVLNKKEIRKHLDSIDYHSYFLHPVKPFFSNRIAYLKRYRKWHNIFYGGISLKMTEWTHMEGGRDYSINSALVQANIMFEDINYADVTTWSHWIALSRYDYNDGVIYFDENKKTYDIPKRYYSFGNFTKFIERGAVRYEANCKDKDLRILLFKKDKKNVFVIINNAESRKEISIDGFSDGKMYITDDKRNLEKTNINAEHIELSPKSVNTVVFKGA